MEVPCHEPTPAPQVSASGVTAAWTPIPPRPSHGLSCRAGIGNSAEQFAEEAARAPPTLRSVLAAVLIAFTVLMAAPSLLSRLARGAVVSALGLGEAFKFAPVQKDAPAAAALIDRPPLRSYGRMSDPHLGQVNTIGCCWFCVMRVPLR